MRITYDREADAMYIKLRDTEVICTEPVAADGNINVNLDRDGQVVGVEIVFVESALDLIDRERGIEIPDAFPVVVQHDR